MKVTIFASGEGFGHVGRCLGVAEELWRRGEEVKICTYGTAARKAESEGWMTVEVPGEVKYFEKEGKLNLKKSLEISWKTPLNLVKAALKAKKLSKDSDVIIADNYMGALFACWMNKIPTISHFNCVHPASGFVSLSGPAKILEFLRRIQVWLYDRLTNTVIVDFPPPYTVAKYNVEGFLSKPIYSGPLVRKRPEELSDEESLRKELGLEKFILVARGGYAAMSNINPALEKVAEKLGLQIVVLDPTKKDYKNLKFLEFETETYFKLLKSCEMVLTHGGHTTLMECCAFGKPVGLIVSENHGERLRNGMGVEELGIGKMLSFNQANPESIFQLIEKVLEMKSEAEKMKELAKKRRGPEWEADLVERLGK